jgi:hypothetical protein
MTKSNSNLINEPGDYMVICLEYEELEIQVNQNSIKPELVSMIDSFSYLRFKLTVIEEGVNRTKIFNLEIPKHDNPSDRSLLGKLIKEVAPEASANNLDPLLNNPFILTLIRNEKGWLKPTAFKKVDPDASGRFIKPV